MTFQIILKEKIPVECGNCGEPATKRHTYLLEGDARRNPASSAYRHDDCSLCSDHEEFTCDACRAENRGREPSVDGYRWCGTFDNCERFKHLFTTFVQKTVPVEVKIQMDGNMYHAAFGDFINLQESPSGFGETKEEAVANLFREAVGIQQAITDPENQPSQYGTILATH